MLDEQWATKSCGAGTSVNKGYWKSRAASNPSCIFLERDPCLRQATSSCNRSRACQTYGYNADRRLQNQRHLWKSLAVNGCPHFPAISIFFNKEFQAELTQLTLLLFVFQIQWVCSRQSWSDPDHAMKAYSGGRGIVPSVLNLSTRRGWMVSFVAQLFGPQGKNPWHPLNRRLGGSEQFVVTPACFVVWHHHHHHHQAIITLCKVHWLVWWCML